MRVKGIYQHKVVKLLEAVDVPEGTEVEVILPTEQEQEGQLTPEQKEILQRTKGMWPVTIGLKRPSNYWKKDGKRGRSRSLNRYLYSRAPLS